MRSVRPPPRYFPPRPGRLGGSGTGSRRLLRAPFLGCPVAEGAETRPGSRCLHRNDSRRHPEIVESFQALGKPPWQVAKSIWPPRSDWCCVSLGRRSERSRRTLQASGSWRASRRRTCRPTSAANPNLGLLPPIRRMSPSQPERFPIAPESLHEWPSSLFSSGCGGHHWHPFHRGISCTRANALGQGPCQLHGLGSESAKWLFSIWLEVDERVRKSVFSD